MNKVVEKAMEEDIREQKVKRKSFRFLEDLRMEQMVAINLRLEGCTLTEIATHLRDRFGKSYTKQNLSVFFNTENIQTIMSNELKELSAQTRQARFSQNLKILDKCHSIISKVLEKAEEKLDEGKELKSSEIVLAKDLYIEKGLVSYAIGRDAAGTEDAEKEQSDEEKVESWEKESERVAEDIEKEVEDRKMTEEEMWKEAKKVPQYVIAINKMRLGEGCNEKDKKSLIEKFGSMDKAIEYLSNEGDDSA